MLKIYDNLLNYEATIAGSLFETVNHPWEVLPLIKDYVVKIIPDLNDEYLNLSGNVYAHKSAKISNLSTIIGPTIIGANTEVRPGAYIRGNVIIGENCVIGNSTEVKNAIIFNNAQCPHYNYIGDSILGERAHMGAGVVLSNVKSDKTNIRVKIENNEIDTGLRKFSTILGNNVEIGCNSVLCPGTIVFPNTNIYPLTRVRGVIGPKKIVKDTRLIVEKEDR